MVITSKEFINKVSTLYVDLAAAEQKLREAEAQAAKTGHQMSLALDEVNAVRVQQQQFSFAVSAYTDGAFKDAIEAASKAMVLNDLNKARVEVCKSLALSKYRELESLRRQALGDEYVSLHPIRVDGNYL
jgi:hypothetical protein